MTCFACGKRSSLEMAFYGQVKDVCRTHAGVLGLIHLAAMDPWAKLAETRHWMSGSAYQRDRAMAQRLAGVER